MKMQRVTAKMKEQTRKTEVQINEEEIGKLPEKEFRVMIVREWRKCKNQLTKIQKNYRINIQTTQLLKLNTLQKESVAEYLKQKNESVNWQIKWWK